MNQFLANPTFPILAFYYVACLLNFAAALWMAISMVRMRGTDLWIFRLAITFIGFGYAIVAVSMFKNPEYAPHASNLIWWWVIAAYGLLVVLQPTGKISGTLIRIGTYIAAALAVWGTSIVFAEQDAFDELATYYGFFGANLGAAAWMIIGTMLSEDMMRQKRIIIVGVGVIYAALVVAGLQTMQMVQISPY
ncbi:MAG: hypothetical protein OXC38_02780 [Gammaproteobacteria bacterium]|nr:hypothetical protein [Gammaproteobacteria bacterium]